MTVNAFSEAELENALKEHFHHAYQMFAEGKAVQHAAYGKVDGILRCLSGIPYPFFNGVLEANGWEGLQDGLRDSSWEACIREQQEYFAKGKVPWVWFVPEDTNKPLEKALLSAGFQFGGVFRGVAANLHEPMPEVKLPRGVTIEKVTTLKVLKPFTDTVATSFDLDSKTRPLFAKVLAADFKKEPSNMTHWAAMQNGKVISALSTLVKGKAVSVWNGGTLQDLRKRGLCTALSTQGITEAVSSQGCVAGMTWLMADSLAFGISTKFGFQTRLRLHVYLAP